MFKLSEHLPSLYLKIKCDQYIFILKLTNSRKANITFDRYNTVSMRNMRPAKPVAPPILSLFWHKQSKSLLKDSQQSVKLYFKEEAYLLNVYLGKIYSK